MATPEVRENENIEHEIEPRYIWCFPVKPLIETISDCSSWVITISMVCLIVSPLILTDDSTRGSETSAGIALGLFSAGIFGCAAGIACKAAACYAEDEDDALGPRMVEMV